MLTEKLLSLIPPDWEYSFTIQKRGYRYFGYLKVFNRKKTINLNGSSHEIDNVIKSMIEQLETQALGDLKTTA